MSSAGQGGSAKMSRSPPSQVPSIAILGGRPVVHVDDPVCAVLLLFFLAGAGAHMAIFQINRRHRHKFIFSALFFGFCMARILTLVMRIVWASRPNNGSIAIASNVFVQAGVLLLFIVNLIFAQRILRSYQPRFGWSKGLGLAFKFFFVCLVATLIMAIAVTVHSFFTTDSNKRKIDRRVQLFAGTFFAAMAFLPIPITLLAVLTPRSGRRRPETFGEGRHPSKVALLLFTSTVLTLGASFRIGVNFTTPRPASDQAWYHSKACFYCFNFAIELIVVYTYLLSRFDRRFHIPNGSSGPGHYSGFKVDDPMCRKEGPHIGVGDPDTDCERAVTEDKSKPPGDPAGESRAGKDRETKGQAVIVASQY